MEKNKFTEKTQFYPNMPLKALRAMSPCPFPNRMPVKGAEMHKLKLEDETEPKELAREYMTNGTEVEKKKQTNEGWSVSNGFPK